MLRIYLAFLGAAIGAELLLGMVAAPVIFGAANWLGEGVLSSEQSGVLMSQIFIRAGYALLFLAAAALVFELFFGHFARNLRISRIFIALINFGCIAAFTLYFTPTIIAMQQAGEAGGTEFASLHEASVWVFKLAMLAQAALLVSFKPKSS